MLFLYFYKILKYKKSIMIKKYFFKEVPSTNDIAKELLKSEDLIVAYADYQSKGRGRNENKWFGNSGENIYCSFGIRHKISISIDQVIIFQALGAIIVANALREITSEYLNSNILNETVNFKIKYPNDVMAEMKNGEFGKICGVLAEHSFQGEECTESIIGIGVNINQTKFSGITANTPTSLKLLLNTEFDSKKIFNSMVDNFMKIRELEYSKLLEIWRKELNFENKIAIIKNKNDKYKIIELLQNGEIKLQNIATNLFEFIDNGDSIRYDLR